MAINEQTIETIFHLLESAGYTKPAQWDTTEKLDQAILTYTMALRGLTDEEAIAAYDAFSQDPKARFWPKPGELIGYAPKRQLDDIDDSDSAWGSLLECVRSHGWIDPPNQPDGWRLDPDPIRCAAMMAGLSACGGWRGLCHSDASANTANRASFRAAYRAHKQRKSITTRQEDTARLLEFAPRLMLKDS